MTTPKQNKDALGKGIRSLLQSIDSDLKNTAGQIKTAGGGSRYRYHAFACRKY